MVSKELTYAAVEMNSILENMSVELKSKIPEDLQKCFKYIASKEYKFKYDKKKRLPEQELLPKTKGLLAVLYRDYICNEEEKAAYNKELEKILEEKEKEKSQKYNADDIFKKREQEQALPVETPKISWFRKILQKVKSKFGK